jgi:hypothetical protein
MAQLKVQGGSNMTGTNCDLFTHKQSRSYLNHLVLLRNFVHGTEKKKINRSSQSPFQNLKSLLAKHEYRTWHLSTLT